jgi:threonine synthase
LAHITKLSCVACGEEYDQDDLFTCPKCGPDEGILDVQTNIDAARATLSRDSLQSRDGNIWRYRELLPVDSPSPPGLADIGWTPMVDAPRLANALGVRRVRLKDDGRCASGSFKDRASAVGVARAISEGYASIACASTGNAATSLARCAACTGISANIFVSRSVPTGKLAQLLVYGARVFCVEGSYAEAYDLCTQSCMRFGWYNRNCAVNPYLVEGKKTGGLEIAEQCADDPPDWVSVSVGDGCSIAGVQKGLREMREVGVIDWSARMLGVQAEHVAPIADAAKTDRLDRGGTGTTYADSINVAVPRNWRKAVNAVRDSNGAWVAVSDDAIMRAARECGHLSGVFAEPAAAAAVAGVAEARRKNIIADDASVVIMITGNGLKDIDGALAALPSPYRIAPNLNEVEQICG